MKLRLLAAGLGLALMGLAGAASATTITVAGGVTTDNCSLSNFTVSLACDGKFTAGPGGNVTGASLDGLFFSNGVAITGWKQIDAIGSVTSGGVQTGANSLFSINTSDKKSGSWALIDPFKFAANKFYVFALKGSTDQVAYFMDIRTMLGNWTNGDLQTKKFNTADLSNIRLFEAPGVEVVPLPAAGWLLLAGVGGLAAVRRRRKAA